MMADLVLILVPVLAVIVAGMSFYEWWMLGVQERLDVEDAEAIAQSVAALNQRVIAAARLIEPGGSTPSRRSSVSLASSQAAAPPPPRRDPTMDLIEPVLAAADGWSAAVGQRPQSVDVVCRRLRSIMSSAEAPDSSRVNKDCRTLAQAALAYSDDHELFDDRVIQAELNRLLGAVGLTVIEPREHERFDPAVHQMVGRDPALTAQSRQLISKVVRRGLQDRQGILSKAEVRVYD